MILLSDTIIVMKQTPRVNFIFDLVDTHISAPIDAKMINTSTSALLKIKEAVASEMINNIHLLMQGNV